MLVRLLERHQRVLRVAALAACVLSAARAIVHVVEALDGSSTAWAAETPVARPAPRPTATASTPAPDKSGAALVERNLFCSSCSPPVTDAGDVAEDIGSTEPPATSLPLRLIATHVAADRTGRSAATVQDAPSNSQGAYRLGEPLPGAGKVVRIGGRSIDFENPGTGRVERLAIAETAAPPRAAPEPVAEEPHDDAPPARRRGADPELTAALDRGVKAIDETHFEVERGLIESVIARPQSAARGARVALGNGGLRLTRVRPDSAHARLGLKSGDTILAVNGVELSSPDKMLEAVTRLRNETSISLSITRRREPVTLSYQIR